MKYFKKLVGDRIYLSPMSVEDVEKYTKWINDFKVTDYIGRSGNMMTLEQEVEWIKDKEGKETLFYILIILNLYYIFNCKIRKG